MDDGDFEEEEVWSFVREKREVSPSAARRAKDHSLFSSSSSARLSSASRLIPRASANAEENGGRTKRQTAPVDIPDCSKIYRSKSYASASHHAQENGDDNGDEFDDDDDQVPPHEWLAKKLARSQISSFSVCEGAGRTLKGRDQRKVRNAVLTSTGFLE